MKVTSLLEDIQIMDSVNIIIEVLGGGPYFHDSKTLSIIDIFTISGNSLSTCLLPAGHKFIYGRFDYQWGITYLHGNRAPLFEDDAFPAYHHV